MNTHTLTRIGFSALSAFAVLLLAVASGFTQSDMQEDGKIFLPLIQEGDESLQQTGEPVEAAGHGHSLFHDRMKSSD